MAATNIVTPINQNIKKTPKDIIANLTGDDPQKNLLTLATTLAELQEQSRLTHSKINEIEKRTTTLTRERDQILFENDRVLTAKNKLENLCRELHRHNQQIRDENTQRQQEEDTKRRELATKFQTTIDEITSQLANYSEKSTGLSDKNGELSEQLTSVMKDCSLKEQEFEAALKKKELELRIAEVNLEQNHGVLKERTEIIKRERQVSEAERLALYKKCEELATSEITLRSQLSVYVERYGEFQKAIEQSSEMVTSCNSEIEKMKERIKQLEKERNDCRQLWETSEQNNRKTNENIKVIEKEKRQLDIKVDKLDRLCRTLQQERADLKAKVKSLTNQTSTAASTTETAQPKDEKPSDINETPNLFDSELGRIAKTVD